MDLRLLCVSQTAVMLAAGWVVMPSGAADSGEGEKEAAGPTAGSLTAEQKARAVEFMCSTVPKMREGAYAAGRKLGEEGKVVYGELLDRAEAYHRQKLDAAVEEARGGGVKFDAAWSELGKVRKEAMAFLMTDHAKAAAKIAELDGKYGGVEEAVSAVEAAVKRGGGIAGLGDTIGILAEIWVEEGWCAGKAMTLREAAVLHEKKAVPEDLQERVYAMREAAEALEALEEADAYNAGLRWATPAQKAFSGILNRGRYVMGLGPMRLDERLSEAAKGHSEEMARMGYFAHESPVEENQTPDRRAGKAGFEGSFRGENIFWNSAGGTAAGAYRGWWESDGHRFLLFGDGQDVLGLGLSAGGTHWTMMTGRKSG